MLSQDRKVYWVFSYALSHTWGLVNVSLAPGEDLKGPYVKDIAFRAKML